MTSAPTESSGGQARPSKATISRPAALVAVAAFAVVAAGAVRAADRSDIEWLQIPQDRFYLDIPFPGLAVSNSIYYRGKTDGALHYVGRWTGATEGFPRAGVYLIVMTPRTLLAMRSASGIESQAHRYFKDHLRTMGERTSTQNALGDIDYMDVTLDDAQCVFFLQKWTDRFRNVAVGHYCVGAGKPIEKGAVAKALAGIRKRPR